MEDYFWSPLTLHEPLGVYVEFQSEGIWACIQDQSMKFHGEPWLMRYHSHQDSFELL